MIGQCANCAYPLTTDQLWRRMTPAERESSGLRQHRSRGLCSRCYDKAYVDGTLLDFPRLYNDRELVLDEAIFLVDERGLRYRDLPAALGMKREAFSRAVKRAAQRGDERAIRLRRLNPHAKEAA